MLLDTFLKIDKNLVLFFDLFSKNNNGDSIRPIAELLRKKHPEMKFVFCTSKKNLNSKIDLADEIVIEKTLKYYYTCLRAKYIISPMGFPKIKKRKGQVFVQTWHGSPLKKLYLSKDKENQSYKKYAKPFEQTDIFCSQANIHNKNLKEALNLKDEQIFNTGLPRNDILFNYSEEFKTELKKKLNLPLDKKTIFYCPTWRRADRKAMLPFDLSLIKKNFENEYVILIRSHVGKHKWVDENDNPVELFDNKFSFDGGQYPEATHLYLISDILITDYSSAIFDFAITQKPMILYAYDRKEYEKEFGLYFNYEKLAPCDICKNSISLVESIKDIENFYKKYGEKYKQFKNLYLEAEKGNASEKVIDIMFNIKG